MDAKEGGYELELSFDRRKKILELVNTRKSVTIESLARTFPVSRMTIIRDLEKLENDGLLKRVRGGAVSLSHIVVAPPVSRSIKAFTDEQRRIGKEASKRIANGDFIIIESGSTCLALVDNLYEKDNLKIATVSPMIAMRLAEIAEECDKKFEIIIVGGILNVYKNFILGPTAVDMLEHINVDTVFMSVTAIDPIAGITADELNESAVSKTILKKCGKKTIGLIPSVKFNKSSFYKVADITAFDEVITDEGLDKETRELFASKGIIMTVC